MSARSKMAALRKQAAHTLREGGFRNRDIAILLDTSEVYVSVMLRGQPKLERALVTSEKRAPVIKVNREEDPRAIRMAEMYKAGKTLMEIGQEFGITRERVRQLIRPIAPGRSYGGRSVLAEQRKQEAKEGRRLRREQRSQREFGCDYETAFRLNRDMRPTYNQKGTLATAYLDQKRTIRNLYAGVEYSLTFPEWIQAWGDKVDLRGRGRFGLCRIDPDKGFTAANVQAVEMKSKSSETMTRTLTRMNQIRSLEEAGVPRAEIAKQLGVKEGYLDSLRFYSRRMLAN